MTINDIEVKPGQTWRFTEPASQYHPRDVTSEIEVYFITPQEMIVGKIGDNEIMVNNVGRINWKLLNEAKE